ncbi:hypothetical protein GFY24_02710 [Nocardia sp. SYP-A9097]|uniref:hypothetical protein n=1 Tax=Nocardia sp. SYP-A9097 TaxID=2663237 RepID=UPI00129BE435|nr:hypothetical protein [Nocardia sp. SYP-A9097]MRH86389.1 hypothetical protein [Nocardia sp. SYP-A9097]
MPGDDARSELLVSVIESIDDRAVRHTEKLVPTALSGSAVLDDLHWHAEILIDRSDLIRLRGNSNRLMFGTVYQRALDTAPGREAWRAPLLAGLLAAEIEFRGPLRLSQTQNTQLAAEYETLARELTRARLPAHAVLAWRRAVALHRLTEEVDEEDRCGLALARARRRATAPGWRRAPGMASDLLCGYGYRPFWLLGWVAIQIMAIIGLGLLWKGTKPWTDVVYLSVVGFLNPLDPSNTNDMEPPAQVLFAVEAWLGVVSMSVFFALLVRRWFRL